MGKAVDNATLSILSNATIEGNVILLNCSTLDRKQYMAVNAVLENIGGKWNKKAKGHVFTEDPTDMLDVVLLTGEITPPGKYGYFPTPPELAKKVIKLADIESGYMVLEPQAGQAGIAMHVPKDATLHCIELLPDNVAVLEKQGYHVTPGDFLKCDLDPVFDSVVMNPPFERQADIDHVLHAWKCLKPGGRLVSIMSAGVLFRENKKTVEFKSLLDRCGRYEVNPDGAFKASGTMVKTIIVVMDKP